MPSKTREVAKTKSVHTSHIGMGQSDTTSGRTEVAQVAEDRSSSITGGESVMKKMVTKCVSQISRSIL